MLLHCHDTAASACWDQRIQENLHNGTRFQVSLVHAAHPQCLVHRMQQVLLLAYIWYAANRIINR